MLSEIATMISAITTENIGKRYRLGGLRPEHMSLRDTLGDLLTAPFRGFKGKSETQTLWALRDISLEIEQGELVGMIGHNGAGKSTLLKILSRVVKPTTGRARIVGRVGSLLEIGTGFHPDLSGRENVYLSGAILGMHRAEIERKFDEIVSFAEISEFIETPIKWYSSGMWVRLAFSVAAHLEPEILMMDEVLAVGDAAFQQKCLDKMRDIRQQGRTILFVSHDMAAVTRLCRRVVLLESGRIAADGDPAQVVNQYLNSSLKTGSSREWLKDDEAPGDDIARLRRVRLVTETGETISAVDIRQTFGIEITFDILAENAALLPVLELCNETGTELFSTYDTSDESRASTKTCGRHTSTVWVPGNLLAEGCLVAHVALMSRGPATVLHTRQENAVAFHVVDSQSGDSAHGGYVGPTPGVMRPLLRWTNQLPEIKSSH